MAPQLKPLIHTAAHVNPGAYFNASLNLVEGLLRSPVPHSFPVNIDIVLTKACNLRCIFCIAYGSLKKQRWMPFDLYRRIAQTLFPSASGLFICSGGEPFLYHRMRDALALARRHRMRTTVTSNGMCIDAETARWLVKDQSLHELCISFDGAEKQTLESIRRGADYHRILANIDRLTALKSRHGALYPRLWFRFVIMKQNARELPRMIDLCARHGLYKVVVKHLDMATDMDMDQSLHRHPRLAAEVFATARRRGRQRGVQVDLPRLPARQRRPGRCLAPWQFLQIDTDGSLRFCYHGWRQRLGFFQDGFPSIWRGRHYARIRSSMDGPSPYYPYCRHCEVRTEAGTPGANEQERNSRDFLIPGLEKWQVPFTTRTAENRNAFREGQHHG